MAYLTLTRFRGGVDDLLARYEGSSPRMDEVGRDHGLLVHAAAPVPDGLLVMNLWPSAEESEAAARDPRRLAVLRESGLRPEQISGEHHEVAAYRLFGPERG